MLATKLTKEMVENIQIDHGIIYENYGEENQKLIGPTRGGGNFKVERTYRTIEYDGMKGDTQGLTTVDDENATLTVKTLNASLDTFAEKLPGAKITRESSGQKITKIESGSLGIIPDDAYIKNVTIFAQLINGEFRKITIYRALDKNGLDFSAVQKAEGEIEMAYRAHHKYDNNEDPIYSIDTIDSIEMEVI
jgi:hypothetical protein|nr:MAG TPA: major tail protein [Caudoviricetes sp.]